MVNRDYLKQLMAEEKELISLKQIKPIVVPKYDELSVKNLWPHMQNVPQFMKYMPDKLPKNRLPDRDYFFTVLNTVNEEYMSGLIQHAAEQRHAQTN